MKIFSLLLALMLSSTCTITCTRATDTVLLPNQSLQDGQTLISANETFELGFFSPGSSSSRYIGIWYHRVPQQTVVWVANRDQPITDNSGTLTFDGNGNLIIIDGRGRSSIVVYNSGGKANDTMADLLDSGNLVLRGITDSSQVWGQSFDDPTDTFLPGMKLGINGRQNKLLTSWRSLDDPSPGDYYLGIDPNHTGQFFIWQKGNIYWTSGPWNGQIFSAIPEMADTFAYGFEFVSNDNAMYFTYSFIDAVSNSLVSRLILDVSGQIKTLIWEESRWLTVWYQPRTKCDVYNLCGVFSICNENGSRNCQCLKGFVQGSLTDWNAGVTGGGCVRSVDLQCEDGGDQDGFYTMRHVQFPANPQNLSVGRAEECELACLRNCTCTAYSYSEYCTLWHGNIINLQQRQESDSDINGEIGTFQLRLAASELFGGKKRLWIIITVASSSLVLLCLMALLCFLWMRRRKHLGLKRMHEEQSLLNFGDSIAMKLGESKGRGSEFSLFHFPCIAEATANFSDINKLGEGGFGPVYKGQLPNGQEIAVKRLAAHSGQGLVEFKNEILLIAKLQHRNLVRLLGCCIHGEEKLLIYEYMPNKSLDSFIFDSAKGAQLDWGRRLHIIEGISQGLLYLHKHSRLRVIHRDLKASNVLLDGEMTPKISDFGMARIFGSHETQANTRRIVGTYGYMSPEYAAEGLFSVKSDVFSFGVLLLEIVSGRRNSGFYRSGNWLNLLGHSWELWREGKWMELVDPLLGDAYSKQEVSRCIHVALMCVQESAADRPTMSDVITMLSSESAALADPKQPAFFLVRMTAGTDFNPDKPTTGSLNHLTTTVLDGR